MKKIVIATAALVSAAVPFAANATPTDGAKYSTCVPVIVETPDGQVEGLLCLPNGDGTL
jgi:hypothetical protein